MRRYLLGAAGLLFCASLPLCGAESLSFAKKVEKYSSDELIRAVKTGKKKKVEIGVSSLFPY